MDTLSDDTRRKFEIAKIKQHNPFGHLKGKTKQLMFDLQVLVNDTKDLPILEGWIEKKAADTSITRARRVWKKRWVVVCGNYLLWSKEQKVIHDAANREQREEFGRYMICGFTEDFPTFQRIFRILRDFQPTHSDASK